MVVVAWLFSVDLMLSFIEWFAFIANKMVERVDNKVPFLFVIALIGNCLKSNPITPYEIDFFLHAHGLVEKLTCNICFPFVFMLHILFLYTTEQVLSINILITYTLKYTPIYNS